MLSTKSSFRPWIFGAAILGCISFFPQLTQAQAKKPAAKKVAAKPAPAKVQLVGAPKGGPAWKQFKHPVGLSLSYPPSWTLSNANGMLMMTPPDVKQVDGGPAELFLVTADSAGGLTSGSDPRLEQALGIYISQKFPAFARVGATKAIKAGNQPGILMNWEGGAQGQTGRIQVLATILKGYMVSVVAISAKDQIKATRDFTINQIFQSLAAGAGAKDPNVAGKWYLYSFSGTGYSSTGSMNTETKSYMTLLPDGTALWGAKSETAWSARGTDSVGNDAWNSGGARGNNSSDRGQWSAGNGQLIVSWGDGSNATWAYSVKRAANGSRQLILKDSSGKPKQWVEIR